MLEDIASVAPLIPVFEIRAESISDQIATSDRTAHNIVILHVDACTDVVLMITDYQMPGERLGTDCVGDTVIILAAAGSCTFARAFAGPFELKSFAAITPSI